MPQCRDVREVADGLSIRPTRLCQEALVSRTAVRRLLYFFPARSETCPELLCRIRTEMRF